MKVYIKKSDFNFTDKYVRIQAVIDYVNLMLDGLYEFEEIDDQALELYFVDFYASEVNNGGIAQFMHNSGFNKLFNEKIFAGLTSLGAASMKQIFEKACQKLADLSEEDLEKFLSLDMYEYEKVSDSVLKSVKDEFEMLTNEFVAGSKLESLIDLNYEFIAKLKNLCIIEDEQYESKMEELLDAVPDYTVRLEKAEKEYEENKPEYLSIIEDVCAEYNLELQSINAFDHGEGKGDEAELQHNIDNNIWYYHITTDQGYHFIIMDHEKATLVNGTTKEPVGVFSLT